MHGALRYKFVTGVSTTTAEALTLGGGVYQNYAHVMLALCHALGLPTLYVSDHLVGEGGTHAWVKVILPQGRGAVAWAFDPTHGSRCRLRYVTDAVGRD